MERHGELWSGSPALPAAKHATRLLNHAWNRQNRLQIGRQRGGIPPPKILALREIRLYTRARVLRERLKHDTPFFSLSLSLSFYFQRGGGSRGRRAGAFFLLSSHKTPTRRVYIYIHSERTRFGKLTTARARESLSPALSQGSLCTRVEPLLSPHCRHHATFGRFNHELEVIFKLECGDIEYKSSEILACKTFKSAPLVVVPVPNVLLTDEVSVCFYTKGMGGAKSKSFCFWFHCSFVDRGVLLIPKPELDKACKDKKAAKFAENFAVELRFQEFDHADAKRETAS